MDIQLNYLASYLISQIYDLPMNQNWVNNLSIPESIFGVFVTIERSNKFIVNQSSNVHGCIGYYSKNFKTIGRKEALERLVSVGKSAALEDDRSNQFKPLLEDYKAIFKVSWLLYPVYQIDEKGYIKDLKKYFDNQDLGIIVKNGNTATYLPKVFSDYSFKQIKESLNKKASRDSYGSSFKPTSIFYAYKTVEQEFKFYESFVGYPFCKPYLDFILSLEDLPYIVTANKTIRYEPGQWVRNMAVIEGLSNYLCSPGKDVIVNKYKKYMKTLYQLFLTKPKLVRQALTSFIELYENKDEICDYLYQEINDLEQGFEAPQVLIALFRNCKTPLPQIIKDRLTLVKKDIFVCNWDSQLLLEAIKFYPYLRIYARRLSDQIVSIVESYSDQTMTNELAVAFEAITSLLLIDQNLNVTNYLMKIILLLWERWEPSLGLFRFLDGDLRIDITNHILNGQNNLYHL